MRILVAWSMLVLAAAPAALPARAAEKTVAPPDAKAPKKSKVWTNADLQALRSGRVNVVGGGPVATAQPAETATPPSAKSAVPEVTWRAQGQALDARIAQLEGHLAFLELVDDQWSSVARGMDAHDAAAAQELVRIRREHEETEQALQQARGEKVLLEESARTSGVPPGWLR